VFSVKIENQIRTSCYDCHSNETNYPWYSYIAPVSFIIANKTKEARNDLNFSEWESLSENKKSKFLVEIKEEIEEGIMPFTSYTIIHRGAKMNEHDKRELILWANNYTKILSSKSKHSKFNTKITKK
jgi:SOS-response transcriptional repressor LexA